MRVHELTRAGCTRLDRVVLEERDVDLRDRYPSVALALDGRLSLHMVDAVGRPKRFVQQWAYAYRDEASAPSPSSPVRGNGRSSPARSAAIWPGASPADRRRTPATPRCGAGAFRH